MPKKDIKLSATRINTFLQCKQKYWFNYYESLPKVSNPAFKLGLACHKTLEAAGKIWIEKEKFTPSDKKFLLDLYNKASVTEGIEDPEVHNEGLELVKRRLDNFAIGKKIISLEEPFGAESAPININGIPLIGAMDKVIEVDDDTLLIVDYKTSKTAPSADQLTSDIQLSIYDLVAHNKWPNYKRIILALDLLKSEVLYTYRTEKQRELFIDYLKILYDTMVGLKKEDVRPYLNQFCGWCDYRDYCGAYKKACEKSDYNFASTVNYPDEQLISEWTSIKSTLKILEARDRELTMILMEKIRKSSKNIVCGGEEFYIRQNARTTYDIDTAFDNIPLAYIRKMVSLNKKSIEDYVLEVPSIKEALDKTAITNYTAPFLVSRKVVKK